MEKTIRWNVDAEELVKIHAIGLEASGGKKIPAFVFSLLMEIGLIWIFLSILSMPGVQWWHPVLPFFLTLVIPFSLINQYWLLPRWIRSRAKDMAGERVITITDSDFSAKGPKSDMKVPWSEVLRLREAGGYLFLFQRSGLISFLPESELGPDLREFIRVKIKANQAPEQVSTAKRIYRIAIPVLIAVLVIILIIWNLLNAAPR